jgi:mRNA interferase MazF
MIMATFEVWDVIAVPFPYTDRPVQQRRPALIVARHNEAGSPALLWVLMITSARHRRWVGDVEISNLATAGLPVASIVRSAKIATIEMQDAKCIGHLPASDRPPVRARIADICAAALA